MATLRLKLPRRGVTKNIERNVSSTSKCNFCSCCKCGQFNCSSIPVNLTASLNLYAGCPTTTLICGVGMNAYYAGPSPFNITLVRTSANHWSGTTSCSGTTCKVDISVSLVCSGNTLTVTYTFVVTPYISSPTEYYCQCGSVTPTTFILDAPTLITSGKLVLSPFNLIAGDVSLCGDGTCLASLAIHA